METILVVEDRESLAQVLIQSLNGAGYEVIAARDGREGINKIREHKVDLIVSDLKLPHKSGLDLLRASKEHNSLVPVILMTAFGTIETAVKAVKEGAYDFLTKPFDPDHLILIIEKALEKQRLVTENLVLKEAFSNQLRFPKIIGKSDVILDHLEEIKKVAQGKTTVLLMGESGTGKELFARAVHYLSPRKEKAFVAINCAAIPRDLLESELFGHERGAFTGAVGRKIGKFELADKGTIFLDEIGDMDLSLQAKILRVLEEDEVMRVGGTSKVKINVRVVAASNRDLQASIAQKIFREDLFYRLSVFPVTIAPLRDRKEDIPALVEHFISIYSKDVKKGVKSIAPEALEVLMTHPWIGNVRELQNCIERAVILCEGDLIRPEHLGLRQKAASEATLRDIPLEGPLQAISAMATRMVESKMIAKVLKETGGNKTRAAEALQVSYKTLLTKIKEYAIENAGA